MKIAENTLLLGSLAALAIFIGLGYAMPWEAFSFAVNVGLVVFSGLVALQHAGKAFNVYFHGERMEGAPKAHLPVIGNFNIATGGILAALSGLAMLSPELNPLISETPFELLGRFLAIGGMAAILAASGARSEGMGYRGSVGLFVALAIVILVTSLLSYNAGVQHNAGLTIPVEDTTHIPADRPMCPADRQVWGSGSGTYHTRDSVHRRQVIPVRCFTSVEEAEEAGFRAPG